MSVVAKLPRHTGSEHYSAWLDGQPVKLDRPERRCTGGEVKALYVRRSNPQRWEVVGARCEACGATGWTSSA